MSFSLVELMPGARNCVRNWGNVTQEKEVLITTDTSIDPLVTEAFALAAEETGAKVGVITIPGIRGADQLDLGRRMGAGGIQVPKFVIEAMWASDVTLNLTTQYHVHSFGESGEFHQLLAQHNTIYVSVHAALKEALASSFATWPRELEIAIGRKANSQVIEGKKVRVTDPEGTDITFEGYDLIEGGRLGDPNTPYRGFSGMAVGLVPARYQNAEGIIVSSSMHSGIMGPVPTVKTIIEKGRAVQIEGSGLLVDEWRRNFEKHRDKNYGNYPEAGIGTLEECMWGTHPKARRFPAHLFSGTEYMWNWMMGSRRSGTVHFGIGSGGSSEAEGLPSQHGDLELFWPTLTLDEETLIDNGHLLVLDDPEIREIAKKYGDPEEVLKIEWEPTALLG